MLLVLVVMKLALLIIIIEIDRVFTYKKIFNNEQETHNKQLNINAKLTKIANSQIKLWQKVGFLPDDLSFLCDHGINIHQINIDQQLYGYWGARALISVDLNLKKQKTLYLGQDSLFRLYALLAARRKFGHKFLRYRQFN